MPANLVKTPGDEKHWQAAKARAAEEGHEGDWAYVVGIFERMSGKKQKRLVLKKGGFADPIPGRTSPPRGKLTRSELERAIRLAITQEQEAIATYKAQSEATSDAAAKQAFLDNARDEEVHLGVLQAQLDRLCPEGAKAAEEGRKEAPKVRLSKSRRPVLVLRKSRTVQAHRSHTATGKIVLVPTHADKRPAAQAKSNTPAPKKRAPRLPKRSPEEIRRLTEETANRTRADHARWLAKDVIPRATDPTQLANAREAIANCKDKSKPVSRSNYLSFDQVVGNAKLSLQRYADEEAAAKVRATGIHHFAQSGSVFFGPDAKDTIGTGLRPAIARVDVDGRPRYLVGQEDPVQEAYHAVRASMKRGDSIRTTYGSTPHLVTLYSDQGDAEKEYSRRCEAIVNIPTDKQTASQGLLTPDLEKLYGGRSGLRKALVHHKASQHIQAHTVPPEDAAWLLFG